MPAGSTQTVVMFSGGDSSWLAARRHLDTHGPDGVTLLFADTRAEDDDLYRFLDDAAANLGLPVTRVADGRDPWQVFHDDRFLGNTRVAPCSKHLKQIPGRAWVEEHTDPRDTVVVVGIGAWERHRLKDIEAGYYPWPVTAPLLDKPAPTQRQVHAEARSAGLTLPRLYELGFKHNNCGGACVRGGRAQWANLLRTFPERYAAAEAKEEELRGYLGADVAILRDRANGPTRPLTLRAFRERYEQQPSLLDTVEEGDRGGCGIMGCAT